MKKVNIKNNNKQFSIIGLKILDECDKHLIKILEPGYYLFDKSYAIIKGNIELSTNQKTEANFFAKNVSIFAIVGKNGSGKSSILELMYRMINNISFHLVKNQNRPASDVMYFVDGLYADLYYVIGGTIGSLYCRGKFTGIKMGEHRLYFGEKNNSFNDFKDYTNPNNAGIIEIAREFFYSIVTNYSLQSFIDFDFKTESSNKFEANNHKGVNSRGIWINSLFHKNDGYITPIVLNPYRDEGKIDLVKEYQLSNYRLASILIEAKRSNKQFINEYELFNIEYKFEPIITYMKFSEDLRKNLPYDDFLMRFADATQERKTFTSVILRSYDNKFPSSNLEINTISYLYLVYKTLSIASKYPSFDKYTAIGNPNDLFKDVSKEEEVTLKELVDEIIKQESHITVKIRQTLNFLKCKSIKPSINTEFDFTYDEYANELNFKTSNRGLDEIIEHLPPPFFTYNIKLKKHNGKNLTSEPILFQRMSSGEKQFIYTVSTLIYHIKNLLSIQQTNRIRYRNINLVLDEVELCFHPEYQRLFVNNLIQTIKRLHLNTHCAFNIIIATHSPFILSDIPMNNILYLEDGKSQINNEFINPFAANINDILHQSFFLNNGFTGEFARNRINSLLNFLLSKRKSSIWNENNSIDFIGIIGEPIIKEQLVFLYNQKFKIKNLMDLEIEKLKKEIESLKTKK